MRNDFSFFSSDSSRSESKALFLLFWKTNENDDNKNVKASTGISCKAASLRRFENAITFKINIEVETENREWFSVLSANAVEILMVSEGIT